MAVQLLQRLVEVPEGAGHQSDRALLVFLVKVTQEELTLVAAGYTVVAVVVAQEQLD